MMLDLWHRANRELVAKALTEYLFEELIDPKRDVLPDGDVQLHLDLPHGAALSWRATPRHLGNCRARPDSVVWTQGGSATPMPDAVEVFASLFALLDVDASCAAGLLAEMSSTLWSDVRQLSQGRPAAELADLDAVWVEGEMRGHPWVVANKGRLGFGTQDLAAYAPESQQPLALPWLGLSPSIADVNGLDHHQVVREQVGDEDFAALQQRAAAAGLDPDTAVFLPVHPWQWEHRIQVLHAGDIARGDMVMLGATSRRYLPQQSIRTFVDVDDPHRRYLKVSLSILNTSVYRGIPRERALVAPRLSEWFTSVVRPDAFLQEKGTVLLGEVSSVSVAHRGFTAIEDVPYQHTEMLGCIWREPVDAFLADGERAVTMAALMHRDPAGVPYVRELVARSGLDVREWVRRLHDVTLPPLAHVLYRYGATFSPHGQNTMLVTRSGVPVRVVVKDFVDDAALSSEALPELAALPADVLQVLEGGLDAGLLPKWIQSGLLVCVHRYVSEVLLEEFGLPEQEFWAIAEQVFRDYQDRFPELLERFEAFDLDAPVFTKLCLNRLRLLERGYADDAERPTISAVGWVDNPLALKENP